MKTGGMEAETSAKGLLLNITSLPIAYYHEHTSTPIANYAGIYPEW